MPFFLLLLGVLMISRVRYEHLLSRLLRGTHPFVRLVEVLLGVVCLFALRQYALGLGFMLYMISGPLWYLKSRILRQAAAPEEPPLAEEDLF
jgi:phosphatidylserine synthase